MTAIPFTKMHGLGNDFVIIDARKNAVSLTPDGVRAIAARHTGIGCDQLIVMEPANQKDADLFMRIHNADGGEVDACGNATRCVAAILMMQEGRDSAHIETGAGLLLAEARGDGMVAVDMGVPGLDWRDIPLSQPEDTRHLELSSGPVRDPAAVSMGNPHCVFFVDDLDSTPIDELGPQLETHSLFPERANIGFAQILDQKTLRLRVWERGAGLTMACGTGACAAVVAANRRGLTGRQVETRLDGGRLNIDWRSNDHVLMTGPAIVSFTGTLAAGYLS
ncbi:MAG: diaminopimelate epimerase [Rhodospirillaceae bacterium]|jgi:diaminopimelate epimerase|nr:diaminopimelate epimerase [Rhodospirillaceae bacterium]MBT5458330.1 diaminopimelate epimerase [Rhodospirillaceae bacterium]